MEICFEFMIALPEIQSPLTNGKIVKVDCPISEYLASKGENGQVILSRSDLCEILNCPSKWRKGSRPQDRKTWQTDFGSLVDCLITQPGRFNEYYQITPETYENSKGEEVPWTWKSSTCRDWRDDFEKRGFNVCTEEDHAEALEAVRSLQKAFGDQLVRLLTYAKKQVFCIAEYHDKETGVVVHVKTLTDIVPAADDEQFGKTLIDLKTCRSAHPRAWRKAVFEDDLHVQAAMNLDCYCAATGEDRLDFRHLIIENTPPYEPARRFLTTEFLTIGREKYIEAMKLYCRCVKQDNWPSYWNFAPKEFRLDDGFNGCAPEPYMITP